jgi:hypothetical protein
MRVIGLDRLCYTTGCEAPAEFACMRCGKPLCREHAHLIRLERRLDTREHIHDLPRWRGCQARLRPMPSACAVANGCC